MKSLAITCFSVAALKLVMVVTTELRDDADETLNEIAECGNARSANMVFASASFTDRQYVLTDEDFVVQSVETELSEVALGKLASEKALSDSIRHLGWIMYMDHAKANDDLKMLASEMGIALPPQCLPCEQKLNELAELSGTDFDRKYVEMIMADHQETIARFSAESLQGKDKNLRNWAKRELPTLQHHLLTAEALAP